MDMNFEDIRFVEDDESVFTSLTHYGTPRHSGRYPWGSGENKYQRHGGFIAKVADLKAEGFTEKEIADQFGLSVRELRAKKAMDAQAEQNARYRAVERLKDKGYSPAAIAKKLEMGDSTVRSILKKLDDESYNDRQATVDSLRKQADDGKILDIGKGVERHLGISNDKLKNTAAQLKLEGYTVETMEIPTGVGQYTKVKVLAKPGTTRKELFERLNDIELPFEYSQDDGKTYTPFRPPINIDPKRVYIRYAEDGGVDRDGLIELRRNVPDISLGRAHYAQVRIGVEGGENGLYMKGMAMYSDNVPDGYDFIYNTNKKRGTDFEKVLKPQLKDKTNPFGASIKEEEKLSLVQRDYIDKDGNKKQSALNIVKEEGDVGSWKKTLASQFLSKQPEELAKKQLKLNADIKKDEFEEIMSLTNPVVKQKLLRSFADECDSAAVHLDGAALPRQKSHFILPFPEMKTNEIYAPNYEQGEEVILVRYPHSGPFEIPRLKVNNKIESAKSTIGNAKDAVGINAKVAEQLSGADFDGDTVMVIPTRGINVKSGDPIPGLANFDTKSYKLHLDDNQTTYNGKPIYVNEFGTKTLLKKSQKSQEIGPAANLITDMSIKGATIDELVRATKYSMVAVDAYKHGLDYKLAKQELGIDALKEKYQGGKNRGASTLLSRSTSEEHVAKRKQTYKINPETGEKIWELVDDDKLYYNKPLKKDKDGNVTEWGKALRTQSVDKGAEHTPEELYSDPTNPKKIEKIYGDYAKEMKALGDKARLYSLQTGELPKNPQAKITYASEVQSLKNKIALAEQNAPLERKAQLLARKMVEAKIEDNPQLKETAEAMKKVKNQSIIEARATVGAGKKRIVITDKEWEAIQSGAVTKTDLEAIIKNTDERRLKELSMPRESKKLSVSVEAKIRQLDAAGYTQAQIAEKLGISTSTVNSIV